MTIKPVVVGSAYRAAAIGAWALLLAACVAQQQSAPVQAAVPTNAQPSMATYDCGDAGSMTIENHGSSIRVTDPAGTTAELPEMAESAGTRYAQGATAVVLDGQEALVMAGRAEPISCRR